MTKVIGVRFRTAGKIYFFSPGKFEVKRGDQVIVETARVVEFGNVGMGPKEVKDEEITQPLKTVLRLATEDARRVEAKNRKKEIEAFVEEGLTGSDCFVVDVQVIPDNVIVVEIDNEEGVDIDRCVALHRFLESKLDRDVEDYEMEVGSAGITSPFKVLGQYQKNIGKEVELLTKNGMNLSGILKSADSEKFVVTITKKVKSETSKRKVEVEEDLAFGYDEVKYSKNLIRFK